MGVVRFLQQRCKDLFSSSLHSFPMSSYQTRDIQMCQLVPEPVWEWCLQGVSPGPPCPDSPSHPPPTLSQPPVLLCTTMHSKSSTTLPSTSGMFPCHRRSLCLEGLTLTRE